ncbi:TonB-dependent receptor [Litoribacillus peritrichatus]|uniref:Secretin/TonB short N-terminal domain-containing protein n=1 Tax=Litoribacillus peritrichatus TaxID=718191 RepID=A0ABP7NE73_9GAMM
MYRCLCAVILFVVTAEYSAATAIFGVSDKADPTGEITDEVTPGSRDQKHTFNIDLPASDLSQALILFSDQTGVHLIYSSALTEGLYSTGLKGIYTLQSALDVLLESTHLKAVRVNENTLSLQQGSDRKALEVQTLKNINVVAQPWDYEQAHQSTPIASQAVTKSQITEQGMRDTRDVLRMVSGVVANDGESRRDEFFIRGFNAQRDTYIDGVRDDSLYFRDLSNTERIEVIKGPGGAIYGRGSAGGVINRVTKKPQATALREASLILGSYDKVRVELDFAGAVAARPDFNYRFTLANEDSESFRDNVESQRFAMAPALSWSPDLNTEILLQAEYLKQNSVPDRGLIADPEQGEIIDDDITRFYGEPTDYIDNEIWNVRTRFTKRLSERLSWESIVQWSKATLDAVNSKPFGFDEDINGRTTVKRTAIYFPQTQQNWLLKSEMKYELFSGWMDQEWLIGMEWLNQRRELWVQKTNVPNIDLLSPESQSPPVRFSEEPTVDSQFTARTWGGYLQSLFSWSSRWHVLLGGRLDYFRVRQCNLDACSVGNPYKRRDWEFTPRVGLTHQFSEELSFYANYSQAFIPSGYKLFQSNPEVLNQKPEQFYQREIGFKTHLFQDFDGSLALYQIDSKSPLTAVQEGCGSNHNRKQSQGMEVNINGEMINRWSVHANLTYTETVEKRRCEVENKFANIPTWQAALWNSYRFQHGFGAGVGIYYVGDRFASYQNKVTLPAYTRVDTTLFYESPLFDVRFSLNNIFDRDYVESANRALLVAPGAPLNWHFAVTTRL